MRFGFSRGVICPFGLACALTITMTLGNPAVTRAGGLHTIPRLTPAIDLNNGGPYMAPPIPGGHYTGKNIGGKLMGHVRGLTSGLHGGMGGLGHGMGGLGHGGMGGCSEPGCGGGGGLGGMSLGHGGAGACDTCGAGSGLGFGHGHGGAIPSGQGIVVSPAAQGGCGSPGCGLFGNHGHGGGDITGDACGSCGGKGCGSCGGGGLGLGGGGGCGLCGGAGCSACAKARGMIGHLLGQNKIKWFNGPGGPVPLTPGYTPYINVTRSPRDFFAFPPFTPE